MFDCWQPASAPVFPSPLLILGIGGRIQGGIQLLGREIWGIGIHRHVEVKAADDVGGVTLVAVAGVHEVPVVGDSHELFSGADRVGAPDGADSLPRGGSAEAKGIDIGVSRHDIGKGIKVGFRKCGQISGNRNIQKDTAHLVLPQDHTSVFLYHAKTRYRVCQSLTGQGGRAEANLHRFGLAQCDGAVGTAVREGRVVDPDLDRGGSFIGIGLQLAALDEVGVPALAQKSDILGEVEDAVAAAVGLDPQYELDIPPAILILQRFRAANDTDDSSRGGAGAVGVEAAVKGIHAGLDLVQIALEEGGKGDADILEEVGTVGVAVLVEDLAQDPLHVVVLTAPGHGVGNQLVEFAVGLDHRQSQVKKRRKRKLS